ncbi:hypothetical protein VPH13_07765 [Stenotrophomonas pavanii]|uniref:hypothetical protein n=1 Tax=Stenotrophomonas pavanii TaxID=487698 RepID=UPI002DB93480|nr:hypothetical protein [Stenotrophomonas pavanii]MEC4338612.1 hypothetical protein [Stenotrophomonas pavanii]
MDNKESSALNVARGYLKATGPLLDGFGGIQYTAIFLEPNPDAVRLNPSIWPLMRASYVLGLLERSHLACVVTLARNHRWLSGAIDSSDSKNLLAFAACLRGFLEAAADSHDVLRYLPMALIEGRDYLYKALHQPTLVQEEISFAALEDRLLHFAFAQNQSTGAVEPAAPRPKATTAYIREIQNFGVTGAVELYAELCDLTHPAAPSVNCFLDTTTRSYTLNFLRDQDRIVSLLECHNEPLIKLLMYSFNMALTGLAFLARLAPGWPAPSNESLCEIALAARNIPLFDELPGRFGRPVLVTSLQQTLAGLARDATWRT